MNWEKWKSFFGWNRERGCDEADGELPGEEIQETIIVPVEDSLDLHTFRPAEVRELLDDYLREAWKKGFTQVRIIHGKGTGVLRRRVEAILKGHPLVHSFHLADETRGGWGATVVRLQAPREPEKNPTASRR